MLSKLLQLLKWFFIHKPHKLTVIVPVPEQPNPIPAPAPVPEPIQQEEIPVIKPVAAVVPHQQLTPRERKFVKALSKGADSFTKAAITAGYSPRSAGAIACETLKRPHIKQALAEVYERMNLHEHFENTWISILNRIDSTDVKEFIALSTLKLKAQDQIAKLAGLEAAKESKRAVVTYDMKSLLPHAEATRGAGSSVGGKSLPESIVESSDGIADIESEVRDEMN